MAVALVLSVLAGAQTPKATAKKTAVHKANELTLAGLRPGHDSKGHAIRLYGNKYRRAGNLESQLVLIDECKEQLLAIDTDTAQKIQVIRVGHVPFRADCVETPPSLWKTGFGLRLDDPTAKIVRLYGPPDSKSPSSKGGQQLELWYYAFDWAGPDVPQVMEVLCTAEEVGKPGRVVEITLAAPSL